MSGFHRFAVYYLPDDEVLADFGADWLGWDIRSGTARAQPPVEGIAALTEAPRRYGFHATLKPPFRLAEGRRAEDLADEVAALARRKAPREMDGLALTRIGRFLALTPRGDPGALERLAFSCVSDLDPFRQPPSEAELQARRAVGLTPRQDDLLRRWGYPYVLEEFRFHLTLTGPLAPKDMDRARRVLTDKLPKLPCPFRVASIALVGEGADGRFRLLHRHALTG